MSPNIKKCDNWCSHFSENVRILELKSLDLIWFLSPNLSIYFNFVECLGPLWYNHIMRFSVLSRFIEKSMCSIYIMTALFIYTSIYRLTLLNLKNVVQLLLSLNEHNCFITLICLKDVLKATKGSLYFHTYCLFLLK